MSAEKITRVLMTRVLFIVALACLASPASALAGGGPERLFLVVNGRSWASMTVANHYIALRDIPPVNVLYLDWDGSVNSTTIGAFRDRLLTPILEAIVKRGLASQIDCIVYSSDFPYRIDFGDELEGPRSFASGSLTGMTFLYQAVLSKASKSYMALNSNQYMQRVALGDDSYAFRSAIVPLKEEDVSGAPRRWPHIMSTMLAYTSGRGNSVDEAVSYLTRASQADGTAPRGTIYFLENSNIRSKVRKNGFPRAVESLRALGVAAEIVSGTVPSRRNDVMGAMLGSADFRWDTSASTILPGAICENFTSFGGILVDGAAQTPLSELLRYGAAGASGTVIEPYAIAQKFPAPTIHVHYARGCNLAEAFYQSVSGPYQLLIVGDPLCQPWATIPQVSVSGAMAGQTLSGIVSLKPTARYAGGRELRHFQLFVDGLVSQRCKPGGTLELDTSTLRDGYHELRVVATVDDSISTEGRLIVPITVGNQGRSVECVAGGKAVPHRSLQMKIDATQADSVLVFRSGQGLARLKGARGTLSVPTAKLGLGPVALQAMAIQDDAEGKDRAVFSPPVRVEVAPGRMLPGRRGVGTLKSTPGMELVRSDGQTATVAGLTGDTWLQKAGVAVKERFQLTGMMEIPESSVGQFELRFAGDLELNVDGSTVFRGNTDKIDRYYAMVPLGKGFHRVELTGQLFSPNKLSVRFGTTGTQRGFGGHMRAVRQPKPVSIHRRGLPSHAAPSG